jgi:hypothetical protein
MLTANTKREIYQIHADDFRPFLSYVKKPLEVIEFKGRIMKVKCEVTNPQGLRLSDIQYSILTCPEDSN